MADSSVHRPADHIGPSTTPPVSAPRSCSFRHKASTQFWTDTAVLQASITTCDRDREPGNPNQANRNWPIAPAFFPTSVTPPSFGGLPSCSCRSVVFPVLAEPDIDHAGPMYGPSYMFTTHSELVALLQCRLFPQGFELTTDLRSGPHRSPFRGIEPASEASSRILEGTSEC